MKALARCLILFGLLTALPLALTGCTDLFSTSSSTTASPEPTASAPPSDVYYDLFTDVPIPREMTADRNRSLVVTAQGGQSIGLITVSGRVELRSLNDAMINNMARHGWALRAVTTGKRTIQIYEKGNQYAVIYTYEETFSTVMEIWVAQRLGDGVYPQASSGGASSSFQLEPAPGQSSPGASTPLKY